ncbi:MAG: signal peptidase II [Cytophagaceae bacterium]|nr:signal peptidase II [Gemmatimonadaceae bacterium]
MTRLRQAPLPPALVRLSRIALLVATADLLSKALASTLWSERALHLTDWVSLAVVQNYGGAFGLSAGAYTWQLNLALTLAAIVFVIPVTKDLTRVDPEAPMALGLIVGGALGNLVSLLAPPAGVGDFIAIHWSSTQGLVLNLADVAAYAGLAMILRTGFRISAELVAQARRTPARIGSAYQAKAEAKRILRLRVEEVPEVVVAEWDKVTDLGVVRADAPEVVIAWEQPRVTTVRRRAVIPIEEIAAPRQQEPRLVRDD